MGCGEGVGDGRTVGVATGAAGAAGDAGAEPGSEVCATGGVAVGASPAGGSVGRGGGGVGAGDGEDGRSPGSKRPNPSPSSELLPASAPSKGPPVLPRTPAPAGPSQAARAKTIGADDYEGLIGTDPEMSAYGLCSRCREFEWARTEFRVRASRCRDLDIRLNASDPVTECTNYVDKTQLSLREMYRLAYYIELRNPIGFEKGGEE